MVPGLKLFDYLLILALFTGTLIIQHTWIYQNKEPVIWDEARHLYISLAYHDYVTGFQGTNEKIRVEFQGLEGRYPPLTYLLTVPFYIIWERGLHAGLSVQSLFLLLIIFYTYKTLYVLTRKSWCAVLGSALCCFSPLMIHFSRRYLLDIPTAAWLIVFIYYLIRSEHFLQTGMTVGVGISVSLCLLTRPDTLPMLILPFTVSLVMGLFSRDTRGKRYRNLLISLFIILIIVVPWYVSHFHEQYTFFQQQRLYNERYNAPILSPESLLYYPIVTGLNFGYGTAVLILVGLVLALFRKKGDIVPVILAIAGGYIFLAWMGYKDWRFLVPFIPLLAVLGVYWLPVTRPKDARVLFGLWIILFSLVNILTIGLDYKVHPYLSETRKPFFYRYAEKHKAMKVFFAQSIEAFPVTDPPKLMSYPVNELLEFLLSQDSRKSTAKIGVFPLPVFPNPTGLSYYSALKRYPLRVDWIYNIPEFHKSFKSYDFLIAPINRPVFHYSGRWETEKQRIFNLRIQEGIFRLLKTFTLYDDAEIGVYRVTP